jgi:hypothetical protein
MKKAMEVLLNRVFKNDLEILYGEGSHVIIKRIYLSEYHKLYIIDCVLMLSDDCPTEELPETYPDGLNYLVNESWKFIVVPEKTKLLSTVEFI